jgi:hypothetical protein
MAPVSPGVLRNSPGLTHGRLCEWQQHYRAPVRFDRVDVTYAAEGLVARLAARGRVGLGESQSAGHPLSSVRASAVRSMLLLFAVSLFTPFVCRHDASHEPFGHPTGSDHAIEILQADF